MLQYRLQPVGHFRCDYATGADFCDAFVTSTDSSCLLAFLLTANHEAAERCFVAARSGFQSQCRFQGVGYFVDWTHIAKTTNSVKLDRSWRRVQQTQEQ